MKRVCCVYSFIFMACCGCGQNTQEIDGLKDQLNKVTTEYATLKSKLSESQREVMLLKQRPSIEPLKEQINNLEAQVTKFKNTDSGKLSDELDRLHAEINAKEKELDQLSSNIKEKDSKILQLKSQLDSIELRVNNASKNETVNDNADQKVSSDLPEVTWKMIDTTGEKYDGKMIRMINLKFKESSNSWVNQLPGITLSSNGLVSTINVKQLEKWIGFYAEDKKGDFGQRYFALKSDFADTILSLDRNTVFDIVGVAIKLKNAGWYGVIVTELKVHK